MFLGIDLHTNRFTCCYIDRTGTKEFKTLELNDQQLSIFYASLDRDTYVLLEATVNSFAFASLFQNKVKQVIIANTYQLKLISMGRKKTDRVDAEKLARILKSQIMSGEEQISRVFVPSKAIQDLRSYFSTYRLFKKQVIITKNRIHSLLKQHLYPFTKEYIFGKKQRRVIRTITENSCLSFQLNQLLDILEVLEQQIGSLRTQIKVSASGYMQEIEILTSMRGISVFTAIAIISDIETVDRFPNSKHFASYLRSTPGVESSNEKIIIKSTNKKGRKVSITLLSQALNHFRDGNPKINRWYNRLSTYKKKGVIRMGMCRRVITEIYQMLKKKQYHYFREQMNHEKKMTEYYRLLETNGVKLPALKMIA